MQLFKQMVTEKDRRFVEHSLNNRFIPEFFFDALNIVLACEEIEYDDKEINFFYKKYNSYPLTKYNDDQELFNDFHNAVSDILNNKISRDYRHVMKFLRKYDYLEDAEPEETKQKLDGDGVVAIIHPFYSYDKDEKRRRISIGKYR